MQEVSQVSSLIADIYDAAVDPALWADVLGKAGDFVGGSAAVLYSKDATRKSANIYYDDGRIDPHYKQLYLDQYVKLDPTSTAEFFVRDRATCRHRRPRPLRRVPSNAPLPGVGAPAGPGGPLAGGARAISDEHCLLRRLSRSRGWHRRRRDAPADAPHRPAHSPRDADRPVDRSQDRRIRRHSPIPSTASVPACSSSTRAGGWSTPMSAAVPCWTNVACCERVAARSPPSRPRRIAS